MFLPPLLTPIRQIGRRTFDFDREVAVMAIVNRTPDSFFDGGRTFGFDTAVAAALAAAAAGASWVDIGGVPFSPDTPLVDQSEEVDRVVPVVAAVTAASDVVVSVDTYRAEVARQSIEAGAAVVNDTTGFRDPDLMAVVAASAATVVITHSLAEPHRHHRRPRYDDVVAEVKAYLAARIQRAVDAGIPESRIVIDPGHDLNKNTLHSLELTRRLAEIAELGLPVLAAVSNKDFIGESTGLAKPERMPPSIATAAYCVAHGARIVRMHDVAPAVAAMRMVEAILGLRAPEHLRHNVD